MAVMSAAVKIPAQLACAPFVLVLSMVAAVLPLFEEVANAP